MGFVIKTKPLQNIYKSLSLEDKGKVQMWLDKTVAENLQKYVSLNSSAQMKSIKTATVLGSRTSYYKRSLCSISSRWKSHGRCTK